MTTAVAMALYNGERFLHKQKMENRGYEVYYGCVVVMVVKQMAKKKCCRDYSKQSNRFFRANRYNLLHKVENKSVLP